MNITRAILELRIEYTHEFNILPFEINNGLCMEFAAEIADMGFGEDIWGSELSIEYWSEDLQPYWDDSFGSFMDLHCFIMYEGKFYDSETPQGCNYPDDLLCYRRNMDLLYESEE